MKITDLRAIAAFHAHAAENATKAASGMGECPVARQFLDNAAQHADWAEKLTELAGAFETFGHVLGETSAS